MKWFNLLRKKKKTISFDFQIKKKNHPYLMSSTCPRNIQIHNNNFIDELNYCTHTQR